jgi:hypothetical protein
VSFSLEARAPSDPSSSSAPSAPSAPLVAPTTSAPPAQSLLDDSSLHLDTVIDVEIELAEGGSTDSGFDGWAAGVDESAAMHQLNQNLSVSLPMDNPLLPAPETPASETLARGPGDATYPAPALSSGQGSSNLPARATSPAPSAPAVRPSIRTPYSTQCQTPDQNITHGASQMPTRVPGQAAARTWARPPARAPVPSSATTDRDIVEPGPPLRTMRDRSRAGHSKMVSRFNTADVGKVSARFDTMDVDMRTRFKTDREELPDDIEADRTASMLQLYQVSMLVDRMFSSSFFDHRWAIGVRV